MAASCAQDKPRWRQDGHLDLNFGGFGAILDVTWRILGGFGEDFGRVLGGVWRLLAPLGSLLGILFWCFYLQCSPKRALGGSWDRFWLDFEGSGEGFGLGLGGFW